MGTNKEKLEHLDTGKLIDIVKNYKQYKYDDDLRNEAIDILNKRGIDNDFLKMTGSDKNSKYELSLALYRSYDKNSKIAFALYVLVILLPLLSYLLLNAPNGLGWTYFVLYMITIIAYFIYLAKSMINQSDFYKSLDKKLPSGDLMIYIVLGMPLYIFIYFFYRSKMKEELQMIT